MEQALKKTLATHKKIVVYGGQGYAVNILTSLKADGFTPVLTYGKQEPITAPITSGYLSNPAIQTLLERLKNGYQSCACCKKKRI